MSTWPSILSTISDPASTDKLNAPSHSSIESAQNDAIKKLETFLGTAASAVGTIMYDVRATASDGGGHVQAANKGGTGQTAFTKGDILVASSSSVFSKLAVGSNNQALIADSNQVAGIKWTGVANAEAIQNQQYTYARASVMSGSVYGVKLSENPSILSDGLGLVIKFPAAPTSSLMALQVFTSSSGSVSALIKKTNLVNPDIADIRASMIGVLEFDSVSSVFQMINVPTKVYKTGTFSKEASDASGTQNIAHGLGVVPKYVRLTLMIATGTTGSTTLGYATTVYNGTAQSSISVYGSAGADVLATTFTLNSPINSSNGTQTGVVTFDETNIIITWTKTSTPSGLYSGVWEAYS